MAVRRIFTEKINFVEEKNITLFFGKNSHLVTYPININETKNAVFIVKQNLNDTKFFSSWRRSYEGLEFLEQKK